MHILQCPLGIWLVVKNYFALAKKTPANCSPWLATSARSCVISAGFAGGEVPCKVCVEEPMCGKLQSFIRKQSKVSKK